MTTLHRLPALALLGLVALLPRPAQAGTCTFALASSTLVNFGTYFALSGDKDQQGNIAFTCLPTGLELLVAYTVQINAGLSGNALQRRMFFGGSSLRYNLFADAARTQVLGDGTGGTTTVAGTCVALCNVPVFGRLYGAQSGPAGPYSDAVTVSINF